MLILEMFQAGLSFECILNKRENFYNAYDEYEENEGGLLGESVYLIYALAGYCSAKKYDEWFEGDDAKQI